MLNLIFFVLAFISGFASAETKWAEAIANGDLKHAATIGLSKDYRASQMKQEEERKKNGPKAVEVDEYTVAQSSEIKSIEDRNDFQFFAFYDDAAKTYKDKAATSIAKKSVADSLEDNDYKSFRNFVIYGETNPQLQDLMADQLLNDSATDARLLKTLLNDPNEKIKASFGKAFWRQLAMRAEEPEEFYNTIKLFLINTNKDDLIKSLNQLDRDGFLADELRTCSPQFWTAVRLIAGKDSKETKKASAVLDEKLKQLAKPDHVANEVVIAHPDHREAYIEKSLDELPEQEKDLDDRKKEMDDPKKRQKYEADKNDLDNHKTRISDAMLKPQMINEDITNCGTSRSILDLSDEDVKKLGYSSNFQKEFWKKHSLASSESVDPTVRNNLPIPKDRLSEEKKWLQQSINFLANRDTVPASGTAAKTKTAD